MALHKKEESNEFCVRPLRMYYFVSALDFWEIGKLHLVNDGLKQGWKISTIVNRVSSALFFSNLQHIFHQYKCKHVVMHEK